MAAVRTSDAIARADSRGSRRSRRIRSAATGNPSIAIHEPSACRISVQGMPGVAGAAAGNAAVSSSPSAAPSRIRADQRSAVSRGARSQVPTAVA